jgi:serine protease Do
MEVTMENKINNNQDVVHNGNADSSESIDTTSTELEQSQDNVHEQEKNSNSKDVEENTRETPSQETISGLQQPVKPKSRKFYIALAAALCLISAIIGSLITIALVPRSSNSNSNFTPIINQTESQSSSPVEQIAKNYSPAVMVITNYQSGKTFFGNNNLQVAGSGSGFVIDSQNGYIVTNNHVIENAKKLTVSLSDGRILDAKVVGADPQTDLAVLQISDTKNLTAVQLGDSTKLVVGEPVVAIGNPGGNEFARSVTTGVVSATNRTLNIKGESSYDLIQTDAAINPGNSGGPLVDYQGLVIGINSAKFAETGYEGMGFTIPISSALPTIQQLIDTGIAKHPALLVSVNDQYNAYAQANNLPQGAYIAVVTENGPAAKAGIMKGDVITKINDVTVQNSSDLVHELFKYQVGSEISVTYLRDGQTKQVKVTLGEITSNQ